LLAESAAVAHSSTEPPLDAAHARAREASAHYAPAEPRALGIMAALAALAIFWVLLPVGIGVLVGALLAFTLHRPYQPLARRSGKPALVAVAMTGVTTLAVGGALGVLLYVVVLQGVTIVSQLPQSFGPGGAGAVLVQQAARPLGVFNLEPVVIVERLRGAVGSIASSLAQWAAQAVGIAFDTLLALLFMSTTMYFVLRHWTELARKAEHLLPINPHHTRRLMRELRRLGRTVVLGNFGTALVQGSVAGIGYAIARLPQPAFFGAITAVASLVPIFGTLLVWVPAALFLLLGGRVEGGVFVLAWGSVAVVGLCDYFVRPKLVGRGETMSMWLTLVALFGGIKLFGVVGLLLGPLLVGMAVAVLRLYERARRFRLGLS
jgi:predicted PurR-regulated permease PerM